VTLPVRVRVRSKVGERNEVGDGRYVCMHNERTFLEADRELFDE